MPTEATENRVQDLLLSILQGIGDVPSQWLTTPSVALGVPSDAVVRQANPQVFLEYARTEARDGESDTASHAARLYYNIWCVSSDPTANGWRDVVNLKADVLRALYAAEGTIQSSFPYGAWPQSFQVRNDMQGAGVAVGVLEVVVDVVLSHSAP